MENFGVHMESESISRPFRFDPAEDPKNPLPDRRDDFSVPSSPDRFLGSIPGIEISRSPFFEWGGEFWVGDSRCPKLR